MADTLHILIIDDSEDDRDFYRRTLHKAAPGRYRTTEAAEGEEGLRMIEAEAPACVLLDYSLPGRNGVEILKRIRTHAPFVPVVMLTGQGNEAVAVTAMREGAQNYISKGGITPDSLEHAVTMAIAHCALERRVENQRNSLEVFTRALTHDLKEPIRTIHSFSNILSREEFFSQKGTEYLTHICQAADRMHELIEAVFLYTRLDDPQRMICDTVESGMALQEVQDDLCQLIRERNAVIVAGALPPLYANHMQLMQLLQNLVINAIRHSQTPVEIHVDAEELPEHWLFRIRDNGPGIAESQLRKIFEPFKRLSHDETGTGLGLSVCQKIVESHGGTLWCESQPGAGATFCFTFPKLLSPAAEAGTPVSSVTGTNSVPTETDRLANVLLVDDRKSDRDLTRILLEDRDHLQCNLLEVSDGEAALEMLQQGELPIDLILLDINMPQMDGFEVLEKIRKNNLLEHVCVVMCTGSQYDKDMERARELGASGYLIKPVEFSRLKEVVEKASILRLRPEQMGYTMLHAA